MSDIIDDIDALVDWQLDQYDNRSGYDHNVHQVDCWHCGREWHGMPITKRVEEIRLDWQAAQYGEVSLDEARAALDAYHIADDVSEVLCPGPDFIGPWATPGQLRRMRTQMVDWDSLRGRVNTLSIAPGASVRISSDHGATWVPVAVAGGVIRFSDADWIETRTTPGADDGATPEGVVA